MGEKQLFYLCAIQQPTLKNIHQDSSPAPNQMNEPQIEADQILCKSVFFANGSIYLGFERRSRTRKNEPVLKERWLRCSKDDALKTFLLIRGGTSPARAFKADHEQSPSPSQARDELARKPNLSSPKAYFKSGSVYFVALPIFLLVAVKLLNY